MNVSFVHSFTTQQQQQQSITSYFLSPPHHTTLHSTPLHCTTPHTPPPPQNFLPPSSFNRDQPITRTRTRTMPISWTPHMDQKLLLAVISTVRLDAEVLVEKWRKLFLGMCMVYTPPSIHFQSFSLVSVSLFSSFIGGNIISVDRRY